MYHARVRRPALNKRIPPACLCSEMYIPELSFTKPRHERRQRRAQTRPGPAARFNKRTFGCWQEAISEALLGGSRALPTPPPPHPSKKPWTLNPSYFKKHVPPQHLLESSDIDMNNFTSQPLQPPARPHGMTVSSDVPSRRTRWKNRRQEITQFQILRTPEKTAAALLLSPFFCGRHWYLGPAPHWRHAETHDIKIQMTKAMSPQRWRLIETFWLEPLRFHENLRTRGGQRLKRCDNISLCTNQESGFQSILFVVCRKTKIHPINLQPRVSYSRLKRV